MGRGESCRKTHMIIIDLDLRKEGTLYSIHFFLENVGDLVKIPKV